MLVTSENENFVSARVQGSLNGTAVLLTSLDMHACSFNFKPIVEKYSFKLLDIPKSYVYFVYNQIEELQFDYPCRY